MAAGKQTVVTHCGFDASNYEIAASNYEIDAINYEITAINYIITAINYIIAAINPVIDAIDQPATVIVESWKQPISIGDCHSA